MNLREHRSHSGYGDHKSARHTVETTNDGLKRATRPFTEKINTYLNCTTKSNYGSQHNKHACPEWPFTGNPQWIVHKLKKNHVIVTNLCKAVIKIKKTYLIVFLQTTASKRTETS